MTLFFIDSNLIRNISYENLATPLAGRGGFYYSSGLERYLSLKSGIFPVFSFGHFRIWWGFLSVVSAKAASRCKVDQSNWEHHMGEGVKGVCDTLFTQEDSPPQVPPADRMRWPYSFPFELNISRTGLRSTHCSPQ